MKLGLYKVNNSLGYDRTTFYNYYDNPRKIEEMLQPLLEKDEAAIINLEDVESIDVFAEEFNDELYDGGWWAVTIRDYEDEPKQKVYVFTAEQAWDGEVAETIVKAFPTREAAQEYMHKFIHEDGDETIAEYVEKHGWDVEMEEPELYRASEEGRYCTDHIELTITECEVKL